MTVDWILVDCPLCGAEPGEWCVTRSGREARRPHVARVRVAPRRRVIRMRTVYLPGDEPKEQAG